MAGRSPASRWPACRRKSSTRSVRCWRAWPSTWRCGARASCGCCCCARKRTATCRPIPRLGFAPTRHALSRIAKEGRKYGCYLGVVTPASGRTRPDHPVAVLDLLRHAARQRAGPGDHPLGDRRFLRVDAGLPVVHGPARGDRLRRRRGDDHAAEVREGLRPASFPAPARSAKQRLPAKPATSRPGQRSSNGCATSPRRPPPGTIRRTGEPGTRRPAIRDYRKPRRAGCANRVMRGPARPACGISRAEAVRPTVRDSSESTLRRAERS